ncbi:hypothetical protein FKM82_027750 [Ascaphus truei]
MERRERKCQGKIWVNLFEQQCTVLLTISLKQHTSRSSHRGLYIHLFGTPCPDCNTLLPSLTGSLTRNRKCYQPRVIGGLSSSGKGYGNSNSRS